MSRYGNIRESKLSASEFRIDLFLSDIGHIDFGNSGVPTVLQKYCEENKAKLEDIFISNDSLYILPKTKEAAGELFKLCIGDKEDEDDSWGIADEINWIKLGDRYWLSLWWD